MTESAGSDVDPEVVGWAVGEKLMAGAAVLLTARDGEDSREPAVPVGVVESAADGGERLEREASVPSEVLPVLDDRDHCVSKSGSIMCGEGNGKDSFVLPAAAELIVSRSVRTRLRHPIDALASKRNDGRRVGSSEHQGERGTDMPLGCGWPAPRRYDAWFGIEAFLTA